MRFALPDGVTLELSKVGRIRSRDRDGFVTYQLTGLQLLGILRVGYSAMGADADEMAIRQLRVMHTECSAGLIAAPSGNRYYWRDAIRSIREAIQLLQGSPEMWSAVFEMEHGGSLPAWASEELSRDSALNRDLRLMYRAGLTPAEAAEQLRVLVAVEELRREFAKEVV